jgi:subtilisin family serine protease
MRQIRAAHFRRTAVIGLITALTLVIGVNTPAAAAEGSILNAGAPGSVKDSYIVVFKKSVSAKANDVARKHGAKVKHAFRSVLSGFTGKMTEQQAKRLAAAPEVAYVEQDKVVRISTDQGNPPSWGLDRIDQRDRPLNQKYSYDTGAAGVNVYVIDTGILTTHQDLGGRAAHGRDTVDNDDDATDCHGHGTHVAGTAAGTEHGVAKSANLVAVRVLNCQGSGSWAGVIAGIDWVTANHVKPAVANMSLGGDPSAAVDQAVQRSIAAGVTYSIAAGNGNFLGLPQNACNYSPARTPEAITVGATQDNDRSASFSNYGKCLDIWAPGVKITSAWIGGDTATKTISGTSMAAPHVAGAAALQLAKNPGATPKQVRDALVNEATPDKVVIPGVGSPNKLLYTGP